MAAAKGFAANVVFLLQMVAANDCCKWLLQMVLLQMSYFCCKWLLQMTAANGFAANDLNLGVRRNRVATNDFEI